MAINNRRFGCEFEFTNFYGELKDITKKIVEDQYGEGAIRQKEKYYHSKNNNTWDFKKDGSTGCELCTPVSLYGNINKICKVYNKLLKSGAVVTKADSLHVHVDKSDINDNKILVLWIYLEPLISKMFPKYRRGQNADYCQSIVTSRAKNKNVAEFLSRGMFTSKDHHSAISLSKRKNRNTVEFRISEAPSNVRHIKNWVKFCIMFVEKSKKIDELFFVGKRPNDVDLQELMDIVNIRDNSLKEWIEERLELF